MLRIALVIFIFFSVEANANKLLTNIFKGATKNSTKTSNLQGYAIGGLKFFSDHCKKENNNSSICINPEKYKFLADYCEKENKDSELCLNPDNYCYKSIEENKQEASVSAIKVEVVPQNKLRKLTLEAMITPALFLGNVLLPGSPFGKDNHFIRSQEVLEARASALKELDEYREWKKNNPEQHICQTYKRLRLFDKDVVPIWSKKLLYDAP